MTRLDRNSLIHLVLIAVIGWVIPAVSADILVDPGFESGAQGWKKHFWVGEEGTDVDLVIDEQVARSGNKSARITTHSTDSKANWEFLYRPDPGVLQTGQSYFARIAVRVEALASTAPAWTFHGVHVRLTSHGPDWSGTHQTSLKPTSFEGDWTIFDGVTILPQPEPVSILLELFFMNTQGSVWFDDAEFYLVTE